MKKKTKNKKIATVDVPVEEPSINYTGTVKVSVIKNNKVYSTKIFKNNGCWPMFYFITCCLSGDYNRVDAYRPQFLQLFYEGEPGTAVPPHGTYPLFQALFDSSKLMSTMAYPYYTNPDIEYSKGADNYPEGDSSITYKFMIPFTQINTTKAINMLGLYCAAKLDRESLDEPSAYLFIESRKGILGDLIDHQPDEDTSEYNLYVEWKLSFKNPIKSSSNN